MTIFKVDVAEGCECVVPIRSSDWDAFASLQGTAVRDRWKPIPVRRVAPSRGKKAAPSDFPWLGSHVLVMRRRAVDAIQEIISADGELLQLATDDGVELFAFNSRIVDALDKERSELERFPGSDRVMLVRRYVFHAELVGGRVIFRIPEEGNPTFVNSRFVEAVAGAGLKGLAFRPVFESGSNTL
jgi:hypothetical protein